MTKPAGRASSSSSSHEPKPSLGKIVMAAARPHTLTASVAPNIVAYRAGPAVLDLSDDERASYFWLTLRWTVFCMLMQLGTNLHNDYADFVKGADDDKRVGQARATQKGWLTPFQTAASSGLTLLLGLAVGLGFVSDLAAVHGWEHGSVWAMVFVVVTSVFNAFAYTGGPWPLGYIGLPNFSLGYSGLGDLFVFLYFGLVATLVPVCLAVSCRRGSPPDALWSVGPPAVQVAVLATNIIVVNNLRDRHTDVRAHKRTLAVRFGGSFCRAEYAANLLVAYGWVLGEAVFRTHGFRTLLPLLSVPLAYKEWKAVSQKEGGALNEHVGGAAKLQLIFCILLAASLPVR